ncbi:MAG: CBS domain-containing protein [Reyranellaceae bacterium]
MRATDIMTEGVICLPEDATVFDAAELMTGSRVSAVPVVDRDNRMVGIVSEADLMRRAELGTAARGSWLSRLLADRGTEARRFVHAHGHRLADVMTREVITAGPDSDLGQLVGLMEKHHVKRLPIVGDDGTVVGIVSRANLLQALLSREPEAAAEDHASDEQLRQAVVGALEHHGWAARWPVNVFVQGGVAHLWGFVPGADVRDACRVAAEEVPGIRRVKSHLRAVPAATALEM